MVGAGRSAASTRDKASEPMIVSRTRCTLGVPSDADLEIDGPRKRVGDRRPLLDVGHQRIDLALRNALAFHVALDPHIGKADRLLADVAGAPDGGDVEITLEFEFELV